jgi:hypothetical protein
MRTPDWLRRPFGRHRESAPQAISSLVEVLRAAVVGDEEDLEQLAVVRGRQRELKAREAAEAAEQQARRERANTSDRALRRRVERYGSWFPSDGPF